MMKRFLQQFLIFGFTAVFCVLLVIGLFRIRGQGDLVQIQQVANVPPGPTANNAPASNPPANTSSSSSPPTNTTPTNAPPTNTAAANTPPATPPATKTASGTFAGDRYRIPWGIVSASIVVTNGKITNVTMPDVPNSPPSYQAEPILIRQAIAAGSANIQGVSGASYTSLAFQKSLESAIANAGL